MKLCKNSEEKQAFFFFHETCSRKKLKKLIFNQGNPRKGKNMNIGFTPQFSTQNIKLINNGKQQLGFGISTGALEDQMRTREVYMEAIPCKGGGWSAALKGIHNYFGVNGQSISVYSKNFKGLLSKIAKTIPQGSSLQEMTPRQD